MATGRSSGSSNVADVSKLTCPICLDSYRRPKLLSCFHTFCQSCLQGVAGSSPAFHCPSCRTRILLPPGGVRDLQTNFYIEEELDATSSPQRRLCDVCTKDREATHTCMQCQQKLCLPCQKYHDALRVTRGHTVVPLTRDEGEGCREGTTPSDYGEDKQDVKMCAKHPDQRLVLHCDKCQADICIQCKLTQHEGHPTADLADRCAKGKARLQDMLGYLTKQLKKTDHLLVAIDDRCTLQQQQQQTTEQEFKSRADRLFQWVNQALDEALSSVQSTSKHMKKTLQYQAKQLRNENLKLQAQRDHIMYVLKDGKEADIVSLEAQLSSSPSDNIDVKQIEKELTKAIPIFPVKHNTTAVNLLQLRAFVGVLEPVEQASCAEETSDSMPSGSNPTELSGRPTSSSAADTTGSVRQKKAPREFVHSQNPKSAVLSMCSISDSRLWVLYRPANGCSLQLKLFDVEGQVLTTVENTGDVFGVLTLCDDIALVLAEGQQTAQLIKPDGSMTSYGMGIELAFMTTCGMNDSHYMRARRSETLYHVKFALADSSQPDSTESQHGQSLPTSLGNPDFSYQLTRSEKRVVFDTIPSSGCPLHVSAGGRYFAFIYHGKVDVCGKTEPHSYYLLSSYTPKKVPLTARFCRIAGQELLLVLCVEDCKVHVVDHTDGGRFVRYLDTGPLNLDRPERLAIDYDKRVWIGCRGGKVVRVDL